MCLSVQSLSCSQLNYNSESVSSEHGPNYFHLHPPPCRPTTHQVTDFFTLSDLSATLSMNNLVLINLCAKVQRPDSLHLPYMALITANSMQSVTFSR